MDSWDYEQYLDEIDYNPQQNNFLDIWQYEGKALDIQEGVLHSEDLSEYLSRMPDSNRDHNFMGGLRLIYSYRDNNEDSDDKEVLWSQLDFVEILEAFQLPKRLTQMIGRCHCSFTEFQVDTPSGEQERYSYIFSTFSHHFPFWMISGSWNVERNITYAFLHCEADPEQQCISRIKRFLIKMASETLHPILLPVLVMDLETNLTLKDDEYRTYQIMEIENETTQRTENYVLERDLHLSIQNQLNCSVFISKIERECEVVLIHLEKAQKMIRDVMAIAPTLTRPSNALLKHTDFLVDSRKNVFFRLKNLQRRCQIRLALTYNLLAQRDNKLNIEIARDSKVIAVASNWSSIAMKTVALLTISFLPGTFVAAIFAMPLFDWQSSTNQSIIGSNFWVYWAVTVPFTIAVLGVWVAWYRTKLTAQNREDNEVRTRSFIGLISGKV